jgi:hypothetical protein
VLKWGRELDAHFWKQQLLQELMGKSLPQWNSLLRKLTILQPYKA